MSGEPGGLEYPILFSSMALVQSRCMDMLGVGCNKKKEWLWIIHIFIQIWIKVSTRDVASKMGHWLYPVHSPAIHFPGLPGVAWNSPHCLLSLCLCPYVQQSCLRFASLKFTQPLDGAVSSECLISLSHSPAQLPRKSVEIPGSWEECMPGAGSVFLSFFKIIFGCSGSLLQHIGTDLAASWHVGS